MQETTSPTYPDSGGLGFLAETGHLFPIPGTLQTLMTVNTNVEELVVVLVVTDISKGAP
jgi:hypothetical protein